MADVVIHEERNNGAIRTFKYRLGSVDAKGKHEFPTEDVSDGYHTFKELYRYRTLYNAAWLNAERDINQYKSRFHSDGEPCFGGGWFIVMAYLPMRDGSHKQISNHYEEKDWDLFDIPERIRADEWDGHTPEEAADRIEQFLREAKQ